MECFQFKQHWNTILSTGGSNQVGINTVVWINTEVHVNYDDFVTYKVAS